MSVATPSFDSPYFRAALGRFATGVTIVTAAKEDHSHIGLTVSSFNSVSLDPPLVVWSLSRGSSSLAAIEACDRYVIQVLGFDQMSLANKFARGTPAERFAGTPMTTAPNGAPRIDLNCAAWFECFNRSRYDEGDHVIFVGQVEHCNYSDALPLVYHAGGYDLTPKTS
jgi:flavin reductase (DIM6/NTAB) family NADH-FMN oxidoreductase RutF